MIHEILYTEADKRLRRRVKALLERKLPVRVRTCSHIDSKRIRPVHMEAALFIFGDQSSERMGKSMKRLEKLRAENRQVLLFAGVSRIPKVPYYPRWRLGNGTRLVEEVSFLLPVS